MFLCDSKPQNCYIYCYIIYNNLSGAVAESFYCTCEDVNYDTSTDGAMIGKVQ